MAFKIGGIIGLVMALIIMGLMLPMGILYLYTAQFVNITVGGVVYTFGEVVDPTLVTLLTVILPIIILISVMVKFIPRK